MSLWDRVFMWRARRVLRPLRREVAADEQRLTAGPGEWHAWWSAHGERELRCILMSAWDPVGSSDTPEAWDEYDDYLAGVGHRLRDARDADAAADAVRQYLAHVERDWIGLEATPEAGRRLPVLAESLAAWHEWSFRRGGRPPHEWLDDD